MSRSGAGGVPAELLGQGDGNSHEHNEHGAVPWGPFMAWAGVAQVPHNMDDARDMMPPGSSLLLDSLPEVLPAKSSGHSSALLPVQPLPERR
jgi:hypothetical protein